MAAGKRLLLASASPRRRELLDRCGLHFDIVPANIDESIVAPTRWIESVPRELAARKAATLAHDHLSSVVLAADTVVVLGGRLLGKPADALEARMTLRALGGRWHSVMTGVAVARGESIVVRHARTRVRLRRLSNAEIDASIERGDPFDKAGGYAIQDECLNPVERYDGCYCNVVGLPLGLALTLLRDVDFAVPLDVAQRLPTQCVACPLWNAHDARQVSPGGQR